MRGDTANPSVSDRARAPLCRLSNAARIRRTSRSGGSVTTMAERAESGIPAEADIDRAPGLLDGAMSLDLTPQTCTVEYWLGAAAQGTLRGLVNGGHRAEAATPTWMREPGPLRQALIEEFAFRSIVEEKATRALSYLVLHAPDTDTMEFFSTQLIDEAPPPPLFTPHP